MILVTPQMRVLVAIEPADFRCGIDGMARRCRSILKADPFSGTLFVFLNRRRTAVKLLVYDGQGFWLCHKRMSSSRFAWRRNVGDAPALSLQAHELSVLLRGGDPTAVQTAPEWRSVTPRT